MKNNEPSGFGENEIFLNFIHQKIAPTPKNFRVIRNLDYSRMGMKKLLINWGLRNERKQKNAHLPSTKESSLKD